MKVTIDRIEENYAVCEKSDKSMINIELSKCPKNISEGDILIIEKNKINIDHKSTEDRKEYIENLTKDLWEN